MVKNAINIRMDGFSLTLAYDTDYVLEGSFLEGAFPVTLSSLHHHVYIRTE